MITQRFTGKSILCTGAGSGIGLALTGVLAREGAQLILVDANQAALDGAAQAARDQGASVITMLADVTDFDRALEVVKAGVKAFGSIDGLYNGAGIAGPTRSFHETDEAIWRKVIDVNLHGSVNYIRAVIPQMMSQSSGVIVNVSSGAGLRATDPGHSPYVTRKHAVIGMSKAAAVEYARYGIRVNAVAPGPTATEMVRKYTSDNPGVEDHLKKRILLGRLGEPTEIVEMILFLLSDVSSFCTGAVYEVNGGELAR